jgi:hypothetical protein
MSPDERFAPIQHQGITSECLAAHLWNGYLKAITVSRGPSLILCDRDVKAMLELLEMSKGLSSPIP